MERNPSISKLPKPYVEQEMLRLIALAHGFENISGSSSSSCSSESDSESGWPVANGPSTQGDFPEWVNQPAFGTSEESVSEYDEDDREADSEECLFETPCYFPVDLGFHEHLYDEEVQETVLVVKKDWGYSSSSMAECEDDDDGVRGIGGVPVPPMLMRRALASSGRRL